MPIRKFNFTGRIRIKRVDIAVTVHMGEGALRFSADINLRNYDLPDDALVVLEAYRQTRHTRFQLGTVGNMTQPSAEERRLDGEFSSPEGILFRAKVLRPVSGLILAQADSIRPDGIALDESLLPVAPAELGEEAWRVNFEGEPVFQVNKNIRSGWREASRSPEFLALVYPAVLRDILNRILFVDKHFRMDEDDEWQSQWLRLAAEDFRAGTPPSPDGDGVVLPEEIDNWVNNAVAGFSRHTRAFRVYNRTYDGVSDGY